MKMECGPENCPLTAWAALSSSERKEQRKPLARKLYEQGFTLEEIAKQFGVTHKTISLDLKDICTSGTNVKVDRGVDTLGRKKSTGRPKGSGYRKGSKSEEIKDRVIQAKDAGASAKEIAGNVGVGERQVTRIIKDEQIRRDALEEPRVERSDLSLTDQKKLDVVVSAYQKRLDLSFRQQVLDEVRRRIDEIILPHWKQQIEQAKELYKHRRGAMDKPTFNKIRRALHPDSRHSISDKVLAEAFDTFMSLEKYLLDEEASPTDFSGLPASLAEWDRAKAEATAARRRTKGPSLVRAH